MVNKALKLCQVMILKHRKKNIDMGSKVLKLCQVMILKHRKKNIDMGSKALKLCQVMIPKHRQKAEKDRERKLLSSTKTNFDLEQFPSSNFQLEIQNQSNVNL